MLCLSHGKFNVHSRRISALMSTPVKFVLSPQCTETSYTGRNLSASTGHLSGGFRQQSKNRREENLSKLISWLSLTKAQHFRRKEYLLLKVLLIKAFLTLFCSLQNPVQFTQAKCPDSEAFRFQKLKCNAGSRS